MWSLELEHKLQRPGARSTTVGQRWTLGPDCGTVSCTRDDDKDRTLFRVTPAFVDLAGHRKCAER